MHHKPFGGWALPGSGGVRKRKMAKGGRNLSPISIVDLEDRVSEWVRFNFPPDRSHWQHDATADNKISYRPITCRQSVNHSYYTPSTRWSSGLSQHHHVNGLLVLFILFTIGYYSQITRIIGYWDTYLIWSPQQYVHLIWHSIKHQKNTALISLNQIKYWIHAINRFIQ